MSTTVAPSTPVAKRYVSRGRNELHTIFERHFADFCVQYDVKYAATYGMYRLERIRRIGERFSVCGDYLQGVARIRCTNPECGYDYFRPFSCKGFYLCPSCSRKRTLLFVEHLTDEVLLNLLHRQFVFTIPKALRPFFSHDRRLFAGISRLIYRLLGDFYCEVAGRAILTGMVIAHQAFGDMFRWNPHFHAIVLEGGFNEEGTFFCTVRPPLLRCARLLPPHFCKNSPISAVLRLGSEITFPTIHSTLRSSRRVCLALKRSWD